MTPKQPKFSIEKLEKRLRDPDHNDQDFAASIGATRNQLRNWRRYGIKLYSADRLAIRLGHHPSYFWPEYWDNTDIDQTSASITTQEEK